MLYAYQLRPHSNPRYQHSLSDLAKKELICMLLACGINAAVEERVLGGTPFLCFDCPPLTPADATFLASHSSLYMAAEITGDCLRPLILPRPDYLPADMPDVLKYKGKTNSVFTHMMINLALAAGHVRLTDNPCILDPICGHGTTLFCALTRGMDAVGIESDKKSVSEGALYAQKWLQTYRIKHKADHTGRTIPGGKNAPETRINVLKAPERSISFLLADTRQAEYLLRKKPAHALVADLPYGVQHAPQDGKKTDGFSRMLTRTLPAWKQAVRKGGAVAVSFNVLTLPREKLAAMMEEAGFRVLTEPCWADNEHFVEQAVKRDLIIALNE